MLGFDDQTNSARHIDSVQVSDLATKLIIDDYTAVWMFECKGNDF